MRANNGTRVFHQNEPTVVLTQVSRTLAIVTMLALVAIQSGCAIRCGPIRTVPPQQVHLFASSPTAYSIRVIMGDDTHIDTAVPPDGRVAFEVPIGSRYCTPYLFGFIKVGWPTPVEKRRVIRVMKGEQVIRKLSASDIARLPQGTDSYHILKIE